MSVYQKLLLRLTSELEPLPDKPEETPEATLRALWLAAVGNPASVKRAAECQLPDLDAAAELRLHELVEQRLGGTPLAHLSRRQRFMGLEMVAGSKALVPRRETELVGRAALELIKEKTRGDHLATVVDVCTGSGNLALSFAHYEARTRVFAADISADAVALARENALHLGLEQRVEFRVGDLLAPFENPAFFGNVDMLTCNPPYIMSHKVEMMPAEISAHEPRQAFDGGALGVTILFRLISEAPRFLSEGGWLCFEVGLGQGRALAQRLERSGHYTAVQTLRDDVGAIRGLAARLP